MIVAAGCDSLSSVDRRTDELLHESADRVGDIAIRPTYDPSKYQEGVAFPKATPNQDDPPSTNVPADQLETDVRPLAERTTEQVIERFTKMVETPENAELVSWEDAFRFAQGHAAEYLTAEESYIITALSLLIEEHRWGPNFFNDTSAVFSANAFDNYRYTTALNVLNTLGVTQKLPYGGDVSARFLVAATEQLDGAIAGGDGLSADLILGANLPLLRGAGLAAREPLIQARRDLIYAARDFQNFRRTFYLDLAGDYLQLIFQKQQILNAERQVQRSREVEDRTVALVISGRTEPFQADLARQNTLFAINRLASLKESHRLSVDNFKLRIGMDTTKAIAIAPRAFDLPVPKVALDAAVKLALDQRLDLQTSSDEVADAVRRLDVAKNDLQGDLNLRLLANMPTDPDKVRSSLQFRPGRTDYTVGLTYSAPLDRTSEEALYRQSQIRLEQVRRNYRQFQERIAIQARETVRQIEKAQFTLLIAERNVAAAKNRQAAIDAAPDRATARDRTDAVNNLQQAEDNLQQSKRDLQLSILGYLASTGQLRIGTDGSLLLPQGMAQAAVDQAAAAQGLPADAPAQPPQPAPGPAPAPPPADTPPADEPGTP